MAIVGRDAAAAAVAYMTSSSWALGCSALSGVLCLNVARDANLLSSVAHRRPKATRAARNRQSPNATA